MRQAGSREVESSHDTAFMNETSMTYSDGAAPSSQTSYNSVPKQAGEDANSPITTHKSDSSSGPKSPERKADVYKVPYVSQSRSVRFHKLFKSAPLEEYPIESFSCAFKGDILLHGQMYVSHNWVCFYSKIKAKGRLIEIPFDKIISITREKLALIIPNAIGIQTANQKYVFGSFISRDSTYKKLVTIWKVSQDAILGSLGVELNLPDDVLGHSETEDSTESDTTEDDLDPSEQLGLALAGGKLRRETEVMRHQEMSVPAQTGGMQPCLTYESSFRTLLSVLLKLQKIPRTNLLLGICTILLFFLILSAMGLTYKILLLQSKLEMRNSLGPHLTVRGRTSSHLYWLQKENHTSVVRQLHTVLEANIHLLDEVHILLTSLCRDWPECSATIRQK